MTGLAPGPPDALRVRDRCEPLLAGCAAVHDMLRDHPQQLPAVHGDLPLHRVKRDARGIRAGQPVHHPGQHAH